MGDPVARACFVPKKAKRYLMASDGIRLVIDEMQFDKYFVFSYINSKYFRNKARFNNRHAEEAENKAIIGLQTVLWV